MRWIACLLFLSLIAPAYSQKKMDGEEFSENLKAKCQLGFDKEIIARIKNAGIISLKIDGHDYISAEFALKIREAKKEVEVRVNIYCSAQGNPVKNSKTYATPRTLIEQEDSGGRYYRHVAWQRNVSGINWKGRIAHVDYLKGDGTALPKNFYMVCLEIDGNLCLEIDVTPPRWATRKARSTVMKMIGRMTYFE